MNVSSGSIDPQSASAVSAKGVMREVMADIAVTDREATADQRIVGIGDSIPIVFCKEEGDVGGAWVSPPAGLYGAITDPNAGDYFAFGMVVSDGQITPILQSDIYKGASKLELFNSHKSTFQYPGMPTNGFNFVLQSVTPGTPSVPGTPGYWQGGNAQASADRRICTGSFQNGTTGSWEITQCAGFTIRLKGGNPSTAAAFRYAIRIYLNGVKITTDDAYNKRWDVEYTFTGDGNYGTVRVEVQAGPYYGSDAGPCSTIHIAADYATRVWVPEIPEIPATPDVVSDLPLFAGKAGSYAGCSCLSVAGQFKDDSGAYTYRQQVRCFVRGGMHVESLVSGSVGPSDQYPDLAWFLLKKARPEGEALIDTASFRDAALYCAKHKMLFNGVVASQVNLRDYLTRVSKLFLLGFTQEQGRYQLKPLLPVNADFSFNTSTIQPAFTFGKDEIVRGSLKRTYAEAGSRQPFCALVTWRSQREALFGIIKTTEVRYANTAPDGPFEQYDLSEFCVTEEHAVLVAKYILASRKYVTHVISFALASNLVQLEALSIIRVNLEMEASNGDRYTDSSFYIVDTIQEAADGLVSVQATHFPVRDNDQSAVALDMIEGSFTIDSTED